MNLHKNGITLLYPLGDTCLTLSYALNDFFRVSQADGLSSSITYISERYIRYLLALDPNSPSPFRVTCTFESEKASAVGVNLHSNIIR